MKLVNLLLRPQHAQLRAISLVFVVSFGCLYINSDWGLPSNSRIEHLGGHEVITKLLPELLHVNEKIKKVGPDGLTTQEKVNHSVLEFLMKPWGADDAYTLYAIGKLRPLQLQFDPHYYMYGGPLIYGGAVAVAFSSLFGYTKLYPDLKSYLVNPDETGRILRVLRMLNVLMGAIGLLFFYFVSRRFFGTTVALIAWALLLFTPVTQQIVRSAEPHIFAFPFAIAALYFIFRFLDSKRYGDIACGAVFVGLTIGTQSSALYLLSAIIFAHWSDITASFQKSARHIGVAIASLVIICIVIVLVNPFYLLNFDEFSRQLYSGVNNNSMQPFKNWAPFQLSHLLLATFLITLTANVIFMPSDRRLRLCLVIGLSGILIYCFLGNQHMSYIYSAIAPLCLLVSSSLISLCQRVTAKYRSLAVWSLFLFILVSPMTRSLYYIDNFNASNQEYLSNWINESIPTGATVAVRFPPTTWDAVPFRFHDYNLMDYGDINMTERLEHPDAIILINVELPPELEPYYSERLVLTPSQRFGLNIELRGELHSLIGKTYRAYTRKI